MERKPFPSETQERFIVRFPDGMRDRIAEAAKANNRSMNAEIVARLEESFQSHNKKFISGDTMAGLVTSNPAVQHMAAQQMYKATLELVRDNPEFKKEIQELLAAALIAGKARKLLAKDVDLDSAPEEVLKDVKQRRQSKASKKPTDH